MGHDSFPSFIQWLSAEGVTTGTSAFAPSAEPLYFVLQVDQIGLHIIDAVSQIVCRSLLPVECVLQLLHVANESLHVVIHGAWPFLQSTASVCV